MLTSLAYSNILATVAVLGLPLVGWWWIAPKLSICTVRYFFTLNIWGIPFVVGQYCQQNGWGPLWIQRHLLDLAYAPWGTALAMAILAIGTSLLGIKITEKALITSGFIAILVFGYASEFWDTAWAWHATGSLVTAADTGDYLTITIGAVITPILSRLPQPTRAKS